MGIQQGGGSLCRRSWEEGQARSNAGASVGPAIPLASLALVVFWACYIGLTSFGVFSAKCTDLHHHYRLRAAYGFMMIFRLAIEFRCLQYVTIPYVQTLGRFQFLNVTIPFELWLAIAFGMLSTPNLIDMLTDSLFVISATENMKCLESGQYFENEVLKVWKAALHAMHLSFLADYHYAVVAGAIWLFTWTQMLYPVFESLPRCWQQTDYAFTVGGDKTKFKNLVGRDCNFGDTLYQLADATGMGSLAIHQPEYPRARERLRRFEHAEDFDAEYSLSFLRAALSEGMVSVGLVGALENVPQILLQSFIFCCVRAAGAGSGSTKSKSFEIQTIVSICFSCLISLTKLAKTYLLISFFREVRGAINDDLAWNISEKAMKDYRSVRVFTTILVVWGFLIIAGVVIALVGVIGSETCEDGIWLPGHSCFSVKSLRHQSGNES